MRPAARLRRLPRELWLDRARSTGPQDISAAVRSLESQLGWFADPIWGRLDGTHDYPESMKRLLGHFLPAFSGIEKELLKVFCHSC